MRSCCTRVLVQCGLSFNKQNRNLLVIEYKSYESSQPPEHSFVLCNVFHNQNACQYLYYQSNIRNFLLKEHTCQILPKKRSYDVRICFNEENGGTWKSKVDGQQTAPPLTLRLTDYTFFVLVEMYLSYFTCLCPLHWPGQGRTINDR